MLRIFDPSKLRVPPPADSRCQPRYALPNCLHPAPSCPDESIQLTVVDVLSEVAFYRDVTDDEDHPYSERAAYIRTLIRSKTERAG